MSESIEFKEYFHSLYCINDIHKICNLSNGTISNIVKELQLKGVTYGKYTRYTEDDLKLIQEFIKNHPNTKTYFYEKTCMEKYGVKNIYQRKDINEKAIKNSHTKECIEKQNKTKEEHYKNEGGYAKHMSLVGKNTWNNYTDEEKENILTDMRNGMIEKYGVKNCSELDWVKEKKKETTLKSIGFDNPLKNREKIEQTMLIKYGVRHNWESKELVKKRSETYHKNCEEYKANKNKNSELRFDDKSKETKIERYGEDYGIKFSNKAHQTMIEKYGEDYGKKFFFEKTDKTCKERYGENYREILIKKAMKTNRKNHGGVHNAQTKESQDKMKQTYFEKTGYYHPSQNPKTRRNHRTCYYYDNEEFDSSWELAYYIYLKDHNIEFQYHTLSVPYEWNGETHYYKIDFKVGNEFVEVKGDHLLKNNVYDDDGRSQAKFQYMQEHNVKILSESEIKPYLQYVKDKYGKDYLKSFRKLNNE